MNTKLRKEAKKNLKKIYLGNRNEKNKSKIKMNKPVSLGMSVLDISKTLMYEFLYDYIKPKYGDRAKLGY